MAKEYQVSLNGNQEGPFNMNQLGAMVAGGKITPDTLVWSEDMPDWAKAATVSDLASLFNQAAEREKVKQAAQEAKSKEVADSVKEFTEKLANMSGEVDDDPKASFITSYPIPNNKEDLLEFAILIASAINNGNVANLYLIPRPWKVKWEQLMLKANIVLANDKETLERIRSMRRGGSSPRNKTVAYLLWLFLGIFGGHRFYLKKYKTAVLYLCTCGCLFIGWIKDLFSLGRQVDEFNATH